MPAVGEFSAEWHVRRTGGQPFILRSIGNSHPAVTHFIKPSLQSKLSFQMGTLTGIHGFWAPPTILPYSVSDSSDEHLSQGGNQDNMPS